MSADSSESSSARRYILLAIKLSISIILMAVLFASIDAGSLWTTARLASIPWLLVALLIFAVNQGAAAWRWRLLLAAQHIHVRGRSLLSSYLVANFFNNFLPSNI